MRLRSQSGRALLISSVALAAVAWWGFKRRSDSFLLTNDGYVVGKTLYRYEDVSYIGWRFGTDALYNTKTVGGGAAFAASSASGVIYITHGTRQVTLASGLPENDSKLLYEEVLRVAANHTKHFQKSQDS